MAGSGSIWSIVLAAGEGSRLRSLTTGRDGLPVPKQFCSLAGGRSLFGAAVDRARRTAGIEQVVAIVAAEHRAFWEEDVAELLPENVLVQPRNRGTAAGILLPALAILERDPHATIVVLPSDHHVVDESVLVRSMREALHVAMAERDAIVLLGMVPDAPVTDYGWIVPRPAPGRAADVAEFAEKPGLERARDLLARGGLWNSFVFAASGAALLDLYALGAPELLGAFLAARLVAPADRDAALAALYERIEPVDFSHDLLEGAPRALRLLGVPPCGWTDLGTPARVAQCLGAGRAALDGAPASSARPILARALAGGSG
jgi:mannose-1-phosphate guanylyltransferase